MSANDPKLTSSLRTCAIRSHPEAGNSGFGYYQITAEYGEIRATMDRRKVTQAWIVAGWFVVTAILGCAFLYLALFSK
jgi:hypothetical protein